MSVILKSDLVKKYAIDDLLYIFNSDLYVNEKGYLQKLVDLLYKMGYYEDNKSLFAGDK